MSEQKTEQPPVVPDGPRNFASPARHGTAVVLFLGLIAAAVWFDRTSREEEASSDTELGFALVESSAELGLEFQHRVAGIDPQVAHVADHIMGVGAAVAVGDVNGDGAVDLYTTSSDFGAPNALFVNRGDGTFEDRAAALHCADLNLEGRGVSMGSIFGDFDNDGDEDLFVYRFGYPALLRNDGEAGFVEVTRAAGLERWANSNGAIWFDYDRDGWLDLYLLGYYRPEHDLWNLTTTRIMHDSGEFATNGAPNWLYRNNGDGTFEDVTARVGLDEGRENAKWSFAALGADFDRDGWPDIYVANDYGSEQLFRNTGEGRFELADADLGKDSKSGMSISLGNLRNDGRWSVFITNISQRGYIFHGNNLRENRMDDAGRMVQGSVPSALEDTGWAWGAQFGDLDLDGFQDLVVVNGFISGDPKRSYWYDAGKLSSGIGGLLADAAYWPAFDGRSQSGYQRTAVLINNGRGGFKNVATAAGITDLLDGRAVALADIENDGDLDLLIANQKGPLLCYRNQVEAGERWIGFELEATRSNRSGIGAEVELTFDGSRQVQVITGGSGFSSQNDRRVHFGIGQNAQQLSAIVRWPSGAEQRLEGLEPGDYVHVVEPASDGETP